MVRNAAQYYILNFFYALNLCLNIRGYGGLYKRVSKHKVIAGLLK